MQTENAEISLEQVAEMLAATAAQHGAEQVLIVLLAPPKEGAVVRMEVKTLLAVTASISARANQALAALPTQATVN